MKCPFCIQDMRRGSMRVAGFGLYPSMMTIRWDPAEGVIERQQTLGVGRYRRPASFCSTCGAVVVPPLDGSPVQAPWWRFWIRR
jgi:hypothetical protein